jgi:4'-phosphopantetheinyl transferase EntD
MASSPFSWTIEALGRVRLGWAERPPADIDRLHPDERQWLERAQQRPERRTEWIAGRSGLALLLPAGAHVLAAADGAPQVVGADWAASVSHEDGWIAVAARPGRGRIGVDVVPDSAAPAAARALARVRSSGDSGDPAADWAALECAAKLRRVGVAVLLDRPVRLALQRDHIRVDGLGRPARVSIRRLPGAVLALADEP